MSEDIIIRKILQNIICTRQEIQLCMRYHVNGLHRIEERGNINAKSKSKYYYSCIQYGEIP